ncbi:Crp/Fnr family transcriptional regulator [Novosphingobium resinovorum]|uniref:Crp/Fnr family transcriptional regulator n=1 Tax=Novosphingobium TaxID=165696 RepID=UPI001B3C607A|nr:MULTISPECIES: Crp/Fnr family transcriptional regulator [Novosphingobium]WJM25957.1 Crp/Fnr family transcriptional regulator [Novosphingobium resinovorum]
MDQSANLLVQMMDDEDRARLAPHVIRVEQERGQSLVWAGRPIEHMFFPEGGIVSVVATNDKGAKTEVGIFGREGMSGVPVLMGSDSTPMEVFTQVAEGTALRVPTEHVREAFAASVSLRSLLLRFCHSFMVQVSFSAMANAHHTLESRLARWLLMCHDRMGTHEIGLTHEFMAVMIAAQRSGVTLTLHMLEGEGLIRSKRGSVTILDRPGLKRLAGESYGKAEEEYDRLIAPMPRSRD